ncbi:MAG: helix-turn-helix transcriptional regulator [Microbispora sp.]|nr:helix-turn-helix transcriptional regulator [Microbispora sp.]
MDGTPIVGDKLRRLREERDWSLEQLARRIGRTRSYLCRLENGQRTPSRRTVYQLAQALGVPYEDLLATSEAACPG